MSKRLAAQVLKRIGHVLGEDPSQSEAMLMEILLDIAHQTAPTAVYRAPMTISAMVIITVEDYNSQSAALKEEGKGIVPPEAYVFDFATNCAKYEKALIESGQGLTRKERALLWLRKLREGK